MALHTKILLFILLIVPWLSVATAKADYVDSDYSAIATSIVGAPITVHCGIYNNNYDGFTWQLIDSDGNSSFQPDIYLIPEICQGLNRLINYRPKKYNQWVLDKYDTMGVALSVLEHEAMHIKLNSGDEGIVECYAFKHMKAMMYHEFNMPAWLYREVYYAAKESHYSEPSEYLAVC